jgi:hypothetical protein
MALIDWGQAGWLPEYWDFYKARFIARFGEEWEVKFIEKVFGRKYGAVYNSWF